MHSKTETTEVVCTRCGLPATAKRPMSQYRATHRGLAECFEATREHASAEARVAAEKEWDGECRQCEGRGYVKVILRDSGFPVPTSIECWCTSMRSLNTSPVGTPSSMPAFLLSTPSQLFDALRENSWTLTPFDMPTIGGDADIGWRVTESHMGKTEPVIVAEVYADDPRRAVVNALAMTTPSTVDAEVQS